jgi:hypothetical protein
MAAMKRYRVHDLVLTVEHEAEDTGTHQSRVLDELSWVGTDASAPQLCLSLVVSVRNDRVSVPQMARALFSVDRFSGLECGEDF